MDEFQRIAAYFGPIAGGQGALSLSDDVAVLRPHAPGSQRIITVDALVEGVHFFASDPIDTVARKLVRVNVSDILAKGALPKEALLTLGWPAARPESELQVFAQSLGEECAAWSIDLVGGDTVRAADGLFLSFTLIGETLGTRPVLRSTTEPGDTIWVTGEIGWGAVGLAAAQTPISGKDYAIERYRTPHIPPIAAASLIADHASASMDVSDGLVVDLSKLCAASGVGAKVEGNRIPLATPVSSAAAAMPQLTGGDDYQILFTARPDVSAMIRQTAAKGGFRVAGIGEVTTSPGLQLFWDRNPVSLPESLGFSHEWS